jgi:hypothetical protein
MGKLGTTLLILTTIGLLGAAAPAQATQGAAALQLGTEVLARTVVQVDRPMVTLRPGEAVTVQVTLKARVAAGEPVALAIEAGQGGAAMVRYEAEGRSGRLAGAAIVGTVRGSGVHHLAVTFTLSPQARGPVTLPVAFQAVVGGAPLSMAAATQVRP